MLATIVLAFCFATCVLAQPGPNATVQWNVSIPNDSWPNGRKYDAFTYDKNAPARLLLSSAIQWDSGVYPPFQTQIIRALDPDTGKILWSSINEYQIAAWTNNVILAVQADGINVQGIEPLTKKVLWTTNNQNVKGMTGCVISGDRFALILNGGILNGGNVLAAFSLTDGSALWELALPEKTALNYMTSCGSNDFCATVYNTQGNVTYFDGATGQAKWTYPGFQASRGLGDTVLVGDGQMFGSSNFVLVTASTGAPLWKASLAKGRYAYDIAVHGNTAYLTYVIVSNAQALQLQKEKRSRQDIQNAYPCALTALSLTDGSTLYGAGAAGTTLGHPSFFDNGDFAIIGSQSISKNSGTTGKNLCILQPIQDYSIVTRPGIDNENNRFFVIGYGGNSMGWDTQQFMSLSCPKINSRLE